MATRSQLVAVDTNVLLDLALPRDDVHAAVELMRQRVAAIEIVVLPTVLDELAHLQQRGPSAEKRALATTALVSLVDEWQFRPLDFIPVGHGIIERIAEKLRDRGLIPVAEINDSLILAEAGLAECSMLITSDGDIRSADPAALAITLGECDVSPVIVRTPREIVAQFSPQRRKR